MSLTYVEYVMKYDEKNKVCIIFGNRKLIFCLDKIKVIKTITKYGLSYTSYFVNDIYFTSINITNSKRKTSSVILIRPIK